MKMAMTLVVILLLHVIAMVHFETMSWGDAIWLTLTSATTVGYGDLSATTLWGRTATIILLYIGGIAILAQVATLYFEYRYDIKMRKIFGKWVWNMNNHIVFFNACRSINSDYFLKVVSGIRTSQNDLSKASIIIVSESFPDGLPDELGQHDVVYVSKAVHDDAVIRYANVDKAAIIVILSQDQNDPLSDSINFELVDKLRHHDVKGRIIVEAIKDTNRVRLKKIGANNVLRPIRAYPELLTRAIVASGSEQVIETLFDSECEECVRYDVMLNCEWRHVMMTFTQHDLGIPIAYEDINGQVINCPSSKTDIKARAIFVIIHQGCMVEADTVKLLFQ